MKQYILSVMLFLGIVSSAFAQSEIKAKMEYDDAEIAFNANDFEGTLKHLNKVEEFVGWNPKAGFLKIQSLEKLLARSNAETEYGGQLDAEVKKYMNFYKLHEEDVVMEKFKFVYAIEQKRDAIAKTEADKKNYKSKTAVFKKMQEYLDGIAAYDKKDYATAMKLWENAAAKNNWLAMDKISGMYAAGVGVEKSNLKEAEWDRKAANLGYSSSMTDLGVLYFYGNGVSLDQSKAMALWVKADELGDENASFNLSFIYGDEKGKYKDKVKAEQWLKKYSTNTSIEAAEKVAYQYFLGENVKINYNLAEVWCKTAIERGSKDVHLILGYLYENGKGVNRDYATAMEWYKKAADNGKEFAMHQIGNMYQNGLGVAKSEEEATKWFTAAAEKGEPESMLQLSIRFNAGLGVKKNKKLAAYWQAKYDATKK